MSTENEITILVAGDQFETVEVLKNALHNSVPRARIKELSSNWPMIPVGNVDEVHEAARDVDELIAALEDVQVCVSHTFPFIDRVFESSPALQQVTIMRGGPVNVNIDSATRHGVQVTYAPGRNATATAEHTVAMILAAVRQIPAHHNCLVTGNWERVAYRYDDVGMEIRGGVIGYGSVGSRVAVIMGANVFVHDPWADPKALEPGITLTDSLDDLMGSCRIVTVHARVTDDSHHMIGAHELQKMPAGSVFVNCARGL